MAENLEKAFYDLVYDAWQLGNNPDNVSRDDFDLHIEQGYPVDEITLDMVYVGELKGHIHDNE